MNKEKVTFIKSIFKTEDKAVLFAEESKKFNQLIEEINDLIRKYHSIVDRSEPFNNEGESIAKIEDWLKILNNAKKAIIQIDSSEAIAPLLQRFMEEERSTHNQILNVKHSLNPRPLLEMASDLDYLNKHLLQLQSVMKIHVKKGRPPVNSMRNWFILELAKIYQKYLKSYPTLTENNSFHQLVNEMLNIIDDHLEDSFGAIKKAFAQNQG